MKNKCSSNQIYFPNCFNSLYFPNEELERSTEYIFIGTSTEEEQDKYSQMVIDSGASAHIVRDDHNFEKIDMRSRIRIKGVAGIDYGYMGTLKETVFGKGLRAIWFDKLPVAALISVRRLILNGWSVSFSATENKARHIATGAVVKFAQTKNGLPSLTSLMAERSTDIHEGYFISPIDEEKFVGSVVAEDVDKTLPHVARKGVAVAGRRRKRGPKETKRSRGDKLLQHWRLAHLHEESERVTCLDCMQGKFKGLGADMHSSNSQKINPSLLLFSTDFFGPVKPETYRGNKVVMIFTCNTSQYVIVRSMAGKEFAPEALESFVREIRSKVGADVLSGAVKTDLVAVGLRSDNEETLKSASMDAVCKRYGIAHQYSTPYMPWTNSFAERTAQTLKNALRTSMLHVDPRIWDYGLRHVAQCWNLLPRHNKEYGIKVAPLEVVNKMTANPLNRVDIEGKRKYLRRFGCLVVFRPGRSEATKQAEKNAVLSPRALRGVNLGWSDENSCWLIGCFPDGEEGRFSVYQCANVVFLEEVLVTDVKKLCSNETAELDEQVLTKLKPSVVHVSSGASVGVTGTSSVREKQLHEQEGPLGISSTLDPENTASPEEIASPINRHMVDIDLREEKKSMPPIEHTDATGAGIPPSNPGNSPNVSYGPMYKPVTDRTRGRPKGSKDKTKRVRRTKHQTQQEADFAEAMYSHLEMEDGEELVYEEIFIAKDEEFEATPGQSTTPSKAFHPENPYRPQWIEATNVEAARLESYKCWRKLNEVDYSDLYSGKIKGTPTALLLCRKRCGRYKARLVVLGNRWNAQSSEDLNLFASVVSHLGNRVALITGAKRKWHCKAFDIGNAFIRASIQHHRVVVSVPPQFRDSANDDGRRMLLKALYGLPISPKLWGDQIAKDLRELGWIEADAEPGLWKMVRDNEVAALLTIYVDDCVVMGESEELVDKLIKQVHDRHPVTMIAMLDAKEDAPDLRKPVKFDLLGADCIYSREDATLRIAMPKYVEKILKKFDMAQKDLKTLPSPDFEEGPMWEDKSNPSKFPFRAVVGALQWLTVTARPDIAAAVNKLARATSNPVNKSMETAGRKVLRYLAGTKTLGLEYSPKVESDFYKNLQELLAHPDNKNVKQNLIEHPVTSYGDASFASTYKQMKSVTGVIVYLYGCPIAWKSTPQTVTATSSMESEWVASSKAIEIADGPHLLMQFLRGRTEKEQAREEEEKGPVLCDNRSAVLSGRKNKNELTRPTRHIAIRHSKLLENGKRIVFVPTELQRADGLTKTSNAGALDIIFPQSGKLDYHPTSEEVDYVNAFLAIL